MLALALALLPTTASAQDEITEFGIFDHLGAGISLGTDGIGIDVAAPVTDWVGVRAGVSFLPNIKIKKNISIDEDPALYDNVDIEAKTKVFDFKLLFDFYPIKTSSFHITAGAFIGGDKVATATNTSPLIRDKADYGNVGIVLGNYRVTTDQQGNADVDVKVNGFKPYIGIGFGRAVPKKSRIAVSCDFGVKFWGTPGLGVATAKPKDQFGGNLMYHKFTYDELGPNDNADLKDAIEIAEKFVVYPVLNIRLSGRIF